MSQMKKGKTLDEFLIARQSHQGSNGLSTARISMVRKK